MRQKPKVPKILLEHPRSFTYPIVVIIIFIGRQPPYEYLAYLMYVLLYKEEEKGTRKRYRMAECISNFNGEKKGI